MKLKVFIDLVDGLSRISTCKRANLGCVIVTSSLTEVVSIGYNGPPAGSPNESCRGTQGTCGCIHAEANALVKLRGYGEGLLLISSLSPCEQCAGLILNSGKVSSIIYQGEYRDPVGLGLLRARRVLLASATAVLSGGMIESLGYEDQK